MERDAARDRRQIAARQRARAVQMSQEGLSVDMIASRLAVTRGTAKRMVSRGVRQNAAETSADDRRLLHVEALMALWRTLYPAASAGDLEAIDRFLRVEERLSILLDLEPGSVSDSADQWPSAGEAESNGNGNGNGDLHDDPELAEGRRFIRTP